LSPELEDLYTFFTEEYPKHKVLDVTDVLTEGRYHLLQTMHMPRGTILLARRTVGNDKVFQKRGDDIVDRLVVFNGAHQVFHGSMTDTMKPQLKKMVDVRLRNENYVY
jgi:hypothetical protein